MPSRFSASPLEYSQCASQQLTGICQDFIKPLGLTTVGYKRVFDDGRYLFLSTNFNWVSYHYQNIHDHGVFFQDAMNHVSSTGFYRVLWPDTPKDHFLKSLHHFGMWNGINFYRKRPDSLELWTFSTSPDRSNMSQLYLNTIEHFEEFIRYFNLRADSLINVRQESQFARINPKIDLREETSCFPDLPDIQIHGIIKGLGGVIVNLTRRESQCIKLLSRGKSMKKIANTLGIGARTVEDYLRGVRNKTGYNSKAQIIDAFNNKF